MHKSICKHCEKPITWDEVFGWIHGVMGCGWNTSCEDDAHRAEPNTDQSGFVYTESVENVSDDLRDMLMGGKKNALDRYRDHIRSKPSRIHTSLSCKHCGEEVSQYGPETWHVESTMIRCRDGVTKAEV